jgi:hypothetical protein
MPTGKTCGNCSNFARIKGWGKYRNGLCNLFDYSCHSDSSYAKKCNAFRVLNTIARRAHNALIKAAQ